MEVNKTGEKFKNPNTPKQVPLYQALGASIPQFVHVPMICGPDGSRLSKRHGAISVVAYKQMGILPESLFNFLSLLGWSPGGDVELLTREETISRFEMEQLNKKSAIFDLKKLLWMNSTYLRQLSASEFVQKGMVFIKKGRSEILPKEICSRGLELIQTRVQSLEECLQEYSYFFLKSYPVDSAAVEKYLKTNEAFSILTEIKKVLEKLSVFDPNRLEASIRDLAQKIQVKAGALIHPLRVAVTGKSVSPGIFETVAALGKETTLERLNKVLQRGKYEFSQ